MFTGDLIIGTFPKINLVVIPFCTKLDTCILDGCVEADHDQVGFGEILSGRV